MAGIFCEDEGWVCEARWLHLWRGRDALPEVQCVEQGRAAAATEGV
jgi:hypothetical protein